MSNSSLAGMLAPRRLAGMLIGTVMATALAQGVGVRSAEASAGFGEPAMFQSCNMAQDGRHAAATGVGEDAAIKGLRRCARQED